MEKFASTPNVPMNLDSSHFLGEVTDFSNKKLFDWYLKYCIELNKGRGLYTFLNDKCNLKSVL